MSEQLAENRRTVPNTMLPEDPGSLSGMSDATGGEGNDKGRDGGEPTVAAEQMDCGFGCRANGGRRQVLSVMGKFA